MAAATPSDLPAELVERSADLVAAVLIDAAGNLIAASTDDQERARQLGNIVGDIVAAADHTADGPVEQLEAHVEGGGVYITRTTRHTLGCVGKRLALPALVLYDQRRALAAIEVSS